MFKKSVIEKDFAKVSKLIHGFPKTGKTTLASKFIDKEKREPVFIATEDGHSALEVYRQRVKNWTSFKKLVEVIEDNQEEVKKKHSCFVLDLVSDLDSWCSEYICEKNQVPALADLAYGKGYQMQAEEFQSQIRKLMNIMPVNYISHAKEKEITWNGQKIKTQTPSMGNRCLEFINGKVDCIMYVDPVSHKEQTLVTMEPSDMAIAGTRFQQLCKSFVLNYEDMGKTYKEMKLTFEGDKK